MGTTASRDSRDADDADTPVNSPARKPSGKGLSSKRLQTPAVANAMAASRAQQHTKAAVAAASSSSPKSTSPLSKTTPSASVPIAGRERRLSSGSSTSGDGTYRRQSSPPPFGSPLDAPDYISENKYHQYRYGSSCESTGVDDLASSVNTAYLEEAAREQAEKEAAERRRAQATVPVVFAWQHGGEQVFVTGTFNDWKERIPLSPSHGEFTTIVNLPPGNHEFKFIVDGEWRADTSLAQVPDPFGTLNNLITVARHATDETSLTHEMSGVGIDCYGQVTPDFAVNSTPQPAQLPPQLLQVILNADTDDSNDPTFLPMPSNHAMLNHLYALSIREGVMVLGATHRYQKKYITTVLYRPVFE